MKMKKRNKGNQIVALVMAIILTSSCFISCGIKQEYNEKEIYNEYIKSTLIPKYGLADLGNFNTDFQIEFYKGASPNYGCRLEDREINLNGITSAYIDDMNEDGMEDMIIVRFKVNTETATIGDIYGMIISAYTIKNNEVILLDEKEVGENHCFSVDDGFEIAQKEWSDRNFYVSAITDGEKKYIFVESIRVYKVYEKGISEYQFVYELDDNELKIPNSSKQVEDKDTYECYIGKYDECTMIEDNYSTYDQSISGNYSKNNIYIKTIEDKYEKRHSIISSKSLINRILSYEWISTDYKNDERKIKAVFSQKANNYANELGIEGLSIENTDKETVVKKDNEEETTVDKYKKQKEMYKEILDKYYTAIVENWDEADFDDEGLGADFRYYNDNLWEFGYKFIDIDKNGVDELFVGSTNFAEFEVPQFTAMYAVIDGKVTEVVSSGDRRRYYLCDDYLIKDWAHASANYLHTKISKFDGTKKLQLVEEVFFDSIGHEKKPWFYTTSEIESERYTNPISEEEGKEIMDEYEPIDMFYTTFSEYKQENNKNIAKTEGEHHITYDEILDNYYMALSTMESEDKSAEDLEVEGLDSYYIDGKGLADIGYTYIDLDGNGTEELLIGEVNNSDSPIIQIYTMRNNEIVLIAESQYRNKWWLCENDIIRNSSTPYARYSSTSFYELGENEKWKFIEGVLYDVDKDEKNPWFYSDQETKDDYENPITEKEKDEVINKYKMMDIEYIPFSEYK